VVEHIGAAFGSSVALGDTLSSSGAIGFQLGKRVSNNLDLTFRDDLISYLSEHY
jgi:hypothetical protein